MLARIGASGDRGRLRVYLGMAPGVGKTYRMLEEGHRRLQRGTDLVVGFVEPHGRPQTAELLDGLEIVPRRRIEYRGVVVEEMDTDAIIARKPDRRPDRRARPHERARARRGRSAGRTSRSSATPASTSSARCNIQHLESVADAVATITGAPGQRATARRGPGCRRRDRARRHEPARAPPADEHGNVYPPERARIALDRFFTESNLTALREIALRFVAGRVDAQLEGIETRPFSSVSERVLVLVDDSDAAPRALRRAAATSAVLRAPLLALVVQTPADSAAGSEPSRRIREHLNDATDLGAEIVFAEATDVAEAIARIAKARRVTRLIMPHRAVGAFERLRRTSLADRILELVPRLEITIVADAPETTDAYRVGRGD